MSSLSEQEHDNLNPNEPAYYAPRWLRDRSDARPAASREAAAEPMRNPLASPASLDTQLEKAVSNALWHPLDPEVIREPPGLAEELDRGSALITRGRTLRRGRRRLRDRGAVLRHHGACVAAAG